MNVGKQQVQKATVKQSELSFSKVTFIVNGTIFRLLNWMKEGHKIIFYVHQENVFEAFTHDKI